MRTLFLLGFLSVFHMVSQDLSGQEELNLVGDRPFSANAQQLLQLSKQWQPPVDREGHSAHASILLDDGEFRVDKNGRSSSRVWTITHFKDRESVDELGVVKVEWSPWCDNRPTIRGRVIGPNGEIHELDPKTIEESPVRSREHGIFTDRKMLRVPLPTLEPGCVSEVVVQRSEHKLSTKSGNIIGYALNHLILPTRLVRFRLIAPEKSQLTYQVLESDAKVDMRSNDGTQTLSLQVANRRAALDNFEPYTTSSDSWQSLILVTTAKSWGDVGAEYQAIVQQQLDKQDVSEVARNFVPDFDRSTEKSDLIESIVKAVRKKVRYTGISFGSASYIPRPPNQVIQRGYGDCKDLSLLVVALLRVAGVDARIALIRARQMLDHRDVHKDVPALHEFNHAIVYVPGNPAIWLDPTAEFTPVGQLPMPCESRLSLVVGPDSSALVRTPRNASKQNKTVERIDVRLSGDGSTSADWSIEFQDKNSTAMRQTFSALTRRQRKEWITSYVGARFGSDEVVEFELTDPRNLTEPFRISAKLRNGFAVVNDGQAVAFTNPIGMFMQLPAEFRGRSSAEQQNTKPFTRTKAMVPPFNFQWKMRHNIYAAAGFEIDNLPDEFEWDYAGVHLALKTEIKDAKVSIAIDFDTGDGQYSATELAGIRQRIADLTKDAGYDQWRPLVQLHDKSNKLLAKGLVFEAAQEFSRIVADDPQNAFRRAEYANALVELGLGDFAKTQAETSVALAPEESYSHQVLGRVLTHNSIGIKFGIGFDRQSAVQSYSKALEIEPANMAARIEYAEVLHHDADGLPYADHQTTKQAISEYRKIYEELPSESVLSHLVFALGSAQQFEELREFLKAQPQSNTRAVGLMLAAAVEEDFDKCWKLAERYSQSQAGQDQLIHSAALTLHRLRLYNVAVMVLRKRDGRGAPNPQLKASIEAFEQARRIDAAELGTDAIGAAKRMLAKILILGVEDNRLRPLFSNSDDIEDDAKIGEEFPGWFRDFNGVFDGNSREFRGDLLSRFDFEEKASSGSFTLLRVRHRVNKALKWNVVLEKIDGRFLVFYRGNDDVELGARCIQLVQGERWDEARFLLKISYEAQKDSLALFDTTIGSPFARLWLVNKGKSNRDVEMGAATLGASGRMAKAALGILLKKTDDIERTYVEFARFKSLLRLEEFDEAKELIDERETLKWKKMFTADYLAHLGDTGRFEEAKELCRYLKGSRHESYGRIHSIIAAIVAEEIPQAKAIARGMMANEQLDPAIKTWLSFLSPLVGLSSDEQFALAEAAIRELEIMEPTLRKKFELGAIPVYAVACAEKGKYLAASVLMKQWKDFCPQKRPTRIDLYIQGMIAEGLQEGDVARALYERITPHDSYPALSAFALAQKRLGKLGNKLLEEDPDERENDPAPTHSTND